MYFGYRDSNYGGGGYLTNEDYKSILNELRDEGYTYKTEYWSSTRGFSGVTHYYSKLKVSWKN